VHAVALTEADARRWADAYNAARTSLYRDPAEVEETELYRDGDPLPQSVTWWNGDDHRTWSITLVITHPAEMKAPSVRRDRHPIPTGRGMRTVFAQGYPTQEACEAAIREELAR
jgi:hypothetical protein